MVDRQYLEEQLAKDYKLLKRLEDKLRLEDDPKRQAKLELDIEELREQIQEREAQKSLAAYSSQNSQQTVDELIQQVRAHCCEKIQAWYSKIRLLNSQQVDVDRLYVEVHILQRPTRSVYATVPGLLQEWNLRNDFDRFGLGWRVKERLSGLDVAHRFVRLMVLGKPGAGKSTFLRYLAIACCKGGFLPDHIPILIELRSIQSANQFTLLEELQREFLLIDQQQTKKVLEKSGLLLLLDGFDEVSDQLRQTLQRQILDLIKVSENNPKIHVVLTCRTQTVEYILPNFEYVEVADFNSEQVELFVHNWFSALAGTPEQGRAQASQFMTTLRLPEHERTAELAVIPVLLSLTCWIFQDTGELPAKRIELYQRGINLLLEQWDVTRGIERTVGGQFYQSLDIEQKQKLLSYVAICKYEQEQFVLFTQQEIQRYIANYFKQLNQTISERDSRDVLKSIESQHGLLIERASEIYSFSHLTFQEFFAAKWFCDPTNQKDLLSFITNNQRIELVRFSLQMPIYADEIAQSVKQASDKLLATDKQLQQFLTWIYHKASSVDALYEPNAIRAFYFSLEYALNPEQAATFSRTFSRPFDRNLDFDLDATLELARILDSNLTNDLHFVVDLTRLDSTYPPNCNLASDFALDLALARARDLARASTLARKRTLALIYNLDYALVHSHTPEAQYDLQELRKQLPNAYADYEKFQAWWKENGGIWTSQLTATMIKYRRIGYNWRLTRAQKKLLQQYYDANKQLTDLLRNHSEVIPTVRQEIEDELLLPIAEIEKRKQVKEKG